jgi:peptidoglycan/LPS O-acetylase OafA/YrhL
MGKAGATERCYGLDWLRIGAFGLLILYHIGMFFVPWDWHTKTAEPLDWLELPMLLSSPWRLSLLFLISGFASRVLLAKCGGEGRFARQRSFRLLVPLLAGTILFVAPQPWIELREKAGYSDGFLQFWLHDYFEFGTSTGLILPTYNHLWFVAYLWIYTMLLALLSLVPGGWRTKAQMLFDRCFEGRRLFILPILFLWLVRAALFSQFGETHAIFDDPYAHLTYGFAFFFGVGLARSRRMWTRLPDAWQGAAKLGIAGYAVVVLLDLTIPGESGELELLVARLARSVQAWGTILALLGLAQRHLHRDSPARRYLTDAIFPYYIAHQTIIVLVGHALKPHGLGAGPEFAIILAATVIGCAATYELVRRVGWLRPLFGLRALGKGNTGGKIFAPA